jgi:uncharacterized protein
MLTTIKDDLKKAMINKDETKKNTLRMVLGEIPRLNKKANEVPTDKEIKNIIRKLIKSETQTLEIKGENVNQSEYIKILSGYLPKVMVESEIKNWIDNNVDFTQFNPRIKAMGFIMKELNGKVNGDLVKKILNFVV